VQVDPIKPTLKAALTKRLKLEYDGPLLKFAFNFNLRRYTMRHHWDLNSSKSMVKAMYLGKYTQSPRRVDVCMPLPTLCFACHCRRFAFCVASNIDLRGCPARCTTYFPGSVSRVLCPCHECPFACVRPCAQGSHVPVHQQGRAVQVDSIKTRVESAYGFSA